MYTPPAFAEHDLAGLDWLLARDPFATLVTTGGDGLPALVAFARQYLNRELDWSLQLILRQEEVPKLRLSRGLRLGYTTWLGHYRRGRDADDLTFDAEARVPLQN